MSIEIAKQLEALKQQVAVASILPAQMEAQHQRRQQLLLEGKTLAEAMAIADAERALKQAQISCRA